MGKASCPWAARAFRRITPVVVSSPPPIRFSAKSGRWSSKIWARSPPSSTMRWGLQDRVRTRWSWYSASVAPCQALTVTPCPARAAATSSWVDRGLQPVANTWAPPA